MLKFQVYKNLSCEDAQETLLKHHVEKNKKLIDETNAEIKIVLDKQATRTDPITHSPETRELYEKLLKNQVISGKDLGRNIVTPRFPKIDWHTLPAELKKIE